MDVNSTKLGNTVAKRNAKLVKIMDAVGDLPLEHGAAQIDAFGDAYEYLMTMYASSAGKSGGEFYTPQEVAEVLATLALDGRSDVARVYDPCAGLGVAAPQIREASRALEYTPVFWSGDQPDNVQPVPHQHVPARRQLLKL